MKFELLELAAGSVIDITEVNDETFSSKVLGDGYAIIPSDGKIYSPIDGKLDVCFPTKHAFGIRQGDFEILIHLGIDTVELNGQGFHSTLKQGQEIRKGDLLCEMNLDLLKKLNYESTSMLVVTSNHSVKIQNKDNDSSDKKILIIEEMDN